MRKIVLVLSFFLALAISAQNETTPRQHSIKLYNLITWEPNQIDRPYANSTHQHEVDFLRLLQPTIAYNWRCENGNAQEIEFTNLSLRSTNTYSTVVNDTTGAMMQVIGGGRTTETHIALRYEYIMNFNRAGVSRWTPSVGTAIAHYFRQYQELPMISITFPTNEQRIGAMLFVIPRLTYRISDRVHLDLNIPLCISDGYFMSEVQMDPNLMAGQRISSFNFQSFPDLYSLRAGIGVLL